MLSTRSPRAGEPATFVAEASMPGGLCCNLTLEFGDGSGSQYPPPPGLGDHSPRSSRESTSSSVRGELHHVYNKGGRWNFRLTARSGGICGPSSIEQRVSGTPTFPEPLPPPPPFESIPLPPPSHFAPPPPIASLPVPPPGPPPTLQLTTTISSPPLA